ncbi:MAG: hypothetical protein IJT41_10955 [Clostridia bacterium]|nr:hypothetical protein [Clostridia bacterium]
MKRFVVFIILLCLLTICVSAKNPQIDGIINLHSEYRDQVAYLQSDRHESNSNVGNVFLYWFSSPMDYSVFLGLAYSCDDFIPGGGLTGVEVTVNNDLCCTVHADGTIADLDSNRFDVDFAFGEIIKSPSKEIVCEIRVGVKYGLDRDMEVGIRIVDCSGNTSNYYRQIVYSPVSSTETTTETATEKTTKSDAKTTTSKPANPDSSKEQSVTAARTTRPVITAAAAKELTATTSIPPTKVKTTSPETAAQAITTKQPTTKTCTTKQRTTKQATTTKRVHTVAIPVAAAAQAAADRTTDHTSKTSAECSEKETTQSTAERYRYVGKVRLVGSVLVAILLTSVFFISIFTGINIRNKKQEDPPITPQEQHEDFG